MARGNWSSVTEFVFLGFVSRPEQQLPLFIIFLAMYISILLGNLTIILLIRIDSRLHTPMYFFLSILACVDICFTTMTVPKLLIDLVSSKRTISFSACITQLHFFFSFGNMDSYTLAIMGFDRFMAICHPLHYVRLMSKKFCKTLIACAWVASSLHSSLHSVLTARLVFCDSNKIEHYFCDLPPLLKLSCSDTTINELVLSTEATIFIGTPFLCIVISYCQIAPVILRLKSSTGKNKAFSTCLSHLTSTVLFYGPIFFTYAWPSAVFTPDKSIWVSVVYSMVASFLNPFVYSIRNEEVKGAFRKMIVKIQGHQ
ncbi:olfactory receptor 1f45-like [Lissotriton helveticus]